MQSCQHWPREAAHDAVSTMVLNPNREGSCRASYGALLRLDLHPVAGVRFDVKPCHVAGRYE
eukprot:8163340-Alexandrium_andersonii.AAC.1